MKKKESVIAWSCYFST